MVSKMQKLWKKNVLLLSALAIAFPGCSTRTHLTIPVGFIEDGRIEWVQRGQPDRFWSTTLDQCKDTDGNHCVVTNVDDFGELLEYCKKTR